MNRKIIYFALGIIAVTVRLILNFNFELIPGVNGGYYPVQIRELLSEGQLGFSDMPLYQELALVGFATLSFSPLILTSGIVNMKPPVISNEAYNDLKKLEYIIDKPDKTIIIARHGLEWWVAWELQTKVAQDKGIDQIVFEKYQKVIILEQKKGINQMHPGKISPFHEPLTPPENKLIYTSEYFNAYEWIK